MAGDFLPVSAWWYPVTFNIVEGQKVAQWVAANMPASDRVRNFGPHVAIGFVSGGKPLVGVVFHEFREMEYGHDARLTIVAKHPMWARKEIVSAILRYPFEQAGCTRITAIVREGNARSIRLVERVGFRKEGVCRRAYNGKTNAIIFGMLREDCERKGWLNG